ncbi:MAG: chemotaxis protein CheA [Geobacter sp.]|nr:MAG: chemotaxis protein CheA [Geobacter sp.]
MTQERMESGEIDLNRFNQVFFEECGEHLAEMEQILLSLSDGKPDEEQLNAVFRAAHSIKGGAGIFGFQDMTVVTHIMESLLDRVRNHEIPFTTAMIDLFLEAGDVIAMQLAGHRDGAEVRQEAVDQISSKLRQYTDVKTAVIGTDATETGVTTATDTTSDSQPGCRLFEMEFTPDPDIFKRGVRLEQLFLELEQLGELTINAEISDFPDFGTFDPEMCATCWQFTLKTAASEEDIREIFEFVADEDQLDIRVVSDTQLSDALGDSALTVDLAGIQAPSARMAPLPPSDNVTCISPGRRASDRNETAPGAFGRRSGEADSSIRVGVTKVDQLINQVGELVITQAMLAQAAAGVDPVQYEGLHRGLLQLERNTRDLQQSVMSIRLVPISVVFNRFPRMVRDLAAKLGKQVELKTFGDTTELDKGLIEKISDPLTHLVRNCLDHALELPDVRIATGKEAIGTIMLRASQLGGRIVIDVIDDGAGLNRAKIMGKALERGIAVSDSMTDDEVWQLIFAPGFSTADAITDISGRGVGMDVVLRNVHSMGGRVQIASESGKGTRVTISLPLTLAILEGISVSVGEEKFIFPLSSIVESIQPKPENLKTVNGRQVVHVRGEYITVLPLYGMFNLQTPIIEPDKGILVLVEVEGERAAILVDTLMDELQVVIKSLEENYRKVEGTSGATILGDGKVALILDVAALIDLGKNWSDKDAASLIE